MIPRLESLENSESGRFAVVESKQANTQNKQPTNPNSALLAQLLLFWAGMTSMPAREAAACGERKIAGRGKALKTAGAEDRKEQEDLALRQP